MPCHHPIRAWSAPSGTVYFQKDPRSEWSSIALPCGKCLGCKVAHRQAWALRCHFENQLHATAIFTTLTYADENLPLTLSKRHLQLGLKRIRKKMGAARPIRFFASGEYGEQNKRPHYHAILYGASLDDEKLVEDAWGLGHAHTYELNPARIAYTAGYTATKLNDAPHSYHERVNPETGEVYTWQPPFIQMSRRPGIGGHVRVHADSWRSYAITPNGYKIPVPRFYHEAWKATATDDQIRELRTEKTKHALNRDTSIYSLNAAEKIEQNKQNEKARKRKL